MNAENKAKAIEQLNSMSIDSRNAWVDWCNGYTDKAAYHRYEQINERACGYAMALDAMGYEIVFDNDFFLVLDIVEK